MRKKELEEQMRGRVKEMKSFYTHLVVYVIVNILLVVVWLLSGTSFPWFVFPLVGWGIGIFFHWYNVFVENGILGKEWEDKKVKELMEKERRRGNQ